MRSRLRRAVADLRARAGRTVSRLSRSAARRERLWIGLALASLAVIFLWFASIHVIVSSRLLRSWVNTSPDELLLSYDSASSWIPGVIQVRGLTMRGSDRNVQWFFRMENTKISLSLLDLLRKRFHATHVRGSGLVFRLREREQKKDLSAAHLARIPKISGFADPPLPIETPEPPLPSAEAIPHYWSVQVEDFVADPVPDIWIEIYRFRGRARVTGGFFLHPHLQVWVGPAAVQFLSGDFLLAPGEPMFAAASGRGDCVIEPYSPDEVRGEQVWRKISGNIRLEGRLEDLRFLNHFLRHSPEPRLEGGAGKMRVALGFTHGIGQGRADFDVGRVNARYGKEAVNGRANGQLEIPRWDVEHDDMEISGSRVALDQITTAGTRRDERDWWGRFEIVAGRLGPGLVARTAVHCRDARPLYTLLHADLPGWAQGILKLEGLEATAGVRIGRDLVDVQNLDASGGKFHIAGRYREKGKSRDGSFLVETGPLAVGISIDGASSHVKLFGARKWFRESSAAAAAPADSGANVFPRFPSARDSSGPP